MNMPELTEWNGFYVIVGSSAGALIGLQFVVLTLIAQRPPVVPVVPEAGAAFATPSVVHFAVALLLSALGSAPWRGNGAVAICWAVVGVVGIIYIASVARRMRVQKAYHPVFEDWLCHVLLPLASYIMLGVAALLTKLFVRGALFMIAAATLLLLFVGIHNAWDAVTFHVFSGGKDREKNSDSD